MLKYMFLFLISLTCLASTPKFHYMDCVKVNSGFYEGCKGNVINYYPGHDSSKSSYSVDITDCKGQAFFADFDEDELEGCKK